MGDDDVIVEEEDKLLYGDLDFADDEQTNTKKKSSNDSPKIITKNESDHDGEDEGEIPDSELFATTVGEKPATSPINKDTEDEDPTTTMDDDTEIDDAIDNAMNIEGLLGSGGGSEVNDSDTAIQIPAVNNDDDTAATKDDDEESSNVDDENNRQHLLSAFVPPFHLNFLFDNVVNPFCLTPTKSGEEDLYFYVARIFFIIKTY